MRGSGAGFRSKVERLLGHAARAASRARLPCGYLGVWGAWDAVGVSLRAWPGAMLSTGGPMVGQAVAYAAATEAADFERAPENEGPRLDGSSGTEDAG